MEVKLELPELTSQQDFRYYTDHNAFRLNKLDL